MCEPIGNMKNPRGANPVRCYGLPAIVGHGWLAEARLIAIRVGRAGAHQYESVHKHLIITALISKLHIVIPLFLLFGFVFCSPGPVECVCKARNGGAVVRGAVPFSFAQNSACFFWGRQWQCLNVSFVSAGPSFVY